MQHRCSCGIQYDPLKHPAPATDTQPNPNDVGFWFTCPNCLTTGVLPFADIVDTVTRRSA